MNKENTKKLFEKYPKLFAGKDKSLKESLMPFGFECGDGWIWLLDNLCDSIQDYVDNNKKPQPEAIQVKEKFGTLSFYMYNMDDLIHGMIWMAESMSSTICEKCGTTENVEFMTDGWMMVRCKECKEN